MKNRAIRWSVFIPVILVLLAMALALIAISYQTFRDYEIEDLKNYAKGLTNLIAGEIIDVNEIDSFLEQGRAHPEYKAVEHKLYKLR